MLSEAKHLLLKAKAGSSLAQNRRELRMTRKGILQQPASVLNCQFVE
jgi:hypothetical protein